MSWKPSTIEDRLLHRYLVDNPGKLFLEVRVGGSRNIQNSRRIDGILIPSDKSEIYAQNEYSTEQLRKEIANNKNHLIEAKRTLNRSVIGQVEVGYSLFSRKFETDNIKQVALCASGETDLEWYCKQKSINVTIYPIQSDGLKGKDSENNKSIPQRNDIRRDPDKYRRQAFFRGWADATKGKLYESVRKRKTHQNMGNLFGWIYGDLDRDFQLETWDRYIKNSMESI